MLPGITPSLRGKAPVFYGNDQYVRALLHPRHGAGTVYSAPFPNEAYAPTTADQWQPVNSPVAVAGGNPANLGRSVAFGGLAGAGANSYLAMNANSGMNITGDFTVDAWTYSPNVTQTGCIASLVGSSPNYGPFVILQVAGDYRLYMSSNGSSWDVANGLDVGNVAANSWMHLALVRKGNTYYFFVNGVQTATFANSSGLYNPPSGQLALGTQAFFGNYYSGYIDEFRFSNGIARWIANFSVPRQNYFSTLSGENDDATVYLLHLDSTFTDEAKGSFVSKIVNVTAASIANPGNTALKQSYATFAANGRITTPQQSDFDFRNNNFSIDCWFRRTSAATGQIIGKRAVGTEFAPWLLWYDLAGPAAKFWCSLDGSTWAVQLSFGDTTLNQWTHLAAMRKDDTIYIYKDGVFITSQFISTNALWNNNNLTSVGNSNTTLNGEVDEVRVSNVARWPISANFVPPVFPYA